MSGEMAYTSLLGLVPSLLIFIGLGSLLANYFNEAETILNWISEFIFKHLVEAASLDAKLFLISNLSKINFSELGIISLGGLLFTFLLLLRSIEVNFNAIWDVSHTRSMLKRVLYFIGFLFLFLFFGTLYLTLLAQKSLVAVLSKMEQLNFTPLSFSALWSAGLFLFLLFSLFKFLPNRSVSSKSAFWGSLYCWILIKIKSQMFQLYTSNLHTHEYIYGAIAAIPLLLIWLYLFWFVLFLGVLITKKIELKSNRTN
jgi:membrane protein